MICFRYAFFFRFDMPIRFSAITLMLPRACRRLRHDAAACLLLR